jgi:hypothetical protein
VDHAGNLVIADAASYRVRVVAAKTGAFYGQAMTAGHIYTIAGDGHKKFSGDGGPATAAGLDPVATAVDSGGNVVVADAANNRVRVVAVHSGRFYKQAMTAGHIYTIAGTGVAGYRGNTGPGTRARLKSPEGLTVDAAGNVVIADTFNGRVRVVAARTGTFCGQPMTAGHIYLIAGSGGQGRRGDGGPAVKAAIVEPMGVAVDAAGNVLIADNGHWTIRAVAVRTGTFYGQAMTAGHIYTIAGTGKFGFSGDGGPGTAAEINLPENVALDAAGNALIPDTFNERIRVVAAATGTFYGQAMTAGHIYTIAGNGTLGFSGDGGPATKAELAFPSDATTDAAGNLLIDDSGNNRIRVVAARTGTFYGQAMTAGHIYTIAGNGTAGFAGDGGPLRRPSYPLRRAWQWAPRATC